MEDYKFTDNAEWYEFDFEKNIFVLTERAPESVKESYKEYLEVQAYLKKHPEITI